MVTVWSMGISANSPMPTFAVMYPRFWHVSPESLFKKMTFELASSKVGSIRAEFSEAQDVAIGRKRCCHNPNSVFFLAAYHPDFKKSSEKKKKKKNILGGFGTLFQNLLKARYRDLQALVIRTLQHLVQTSRSQVNALTSSRTQPWVHQETYRQWFQLTKNTDRNQLDPLATAKKTTRKRFGMTEIFRKITKIHPLAQQGEFFDKNVPTLKPWGLGGSPSSE